ncbi:hypothetical protein BV378_32980 [Nostoc sp. RF31YmG]|nr:hypothetical protein BV378_32980 [Nostoc sp. RF31YmG]
MSDLILEALPDIEDGKPVDISRVYLYAVRRKMERDIKAERTFTSLADKLYFLSELSWEMLSTDQMSLNYRLFPERIRRLFGSVVQQEKDLDHWHYDMMGQTMLIRNADGDYTPAHRSLLEFFVAYKFTAELGLLAPDFINLAQEQSRIDIKFSPQDYTWSSYFKREVDTQGNVKLIPKLQKFTSQAVEDLAATLGKQPLTEAILNLMQTMLITNEEEVNTQLLKIIEATRGKTIAEVGYAGGNVATLLIRNDPLCLRGYNLASTNLSYADFSEHYSPSSGKHFQAADLSKTNLEGAYLHNTHFAEVLLVNANLSYSSLDGSVGLLRERSFYEKVAISSDNSFLVAGGIEGIVKIFYLKDGSEKIIAQGLSWISCLAISCDNRLVAIGDNQGRFIVYDLKSLELIFDIYDHNDCVADLIFDKSVNNLIAISGGNPPQDDSIRIYTLSEGEIIWHHQHTEGFDQLLYCTSSHTLVTLDWQGGVDIWNLEKKEHIKNIYSQDEKKLKNHISLDQTSSLLLIASITISKNFTKVLAQEKQMIQFQPKLSILNINNSEVIWEMKDFSKLNNKFNHAVLSPDSTKIAFSIDNFWLVFWDRLQETEIWRSKEHIDEIESIVFSKNGQYIITGSRDCTIKIWDIEKGISIKTFCTSKNYRGLQLIGTKGLDNTMLTALQQRGALI